MNKKTIILALLAVLTLGQVQAWAFHQTQDKQTAKERLAFERRRQIFSEGQLFDIFSKPMTEEEAHAMRFLYAYMPTGDLVDYSGEFYLDHVRSSLRARMEMPWGKSIPEREWRHFVLPVRVNNEALDTARLVFYNELKERVRHLSLYDAVLEVNHWCHEHVVYAPSDSRTSAPLATIRSAYGRCGEESTLLVAALRSVGIPARQVYTPRWAHTDDNHAWVEAWVDGQWYFLGACEPEPVLNLAWFNAPVSRAMLIHTKAFGDYDGPEEVMNRTPTYTEINVVANYAHTASIAVQVVSPSGRIQSDVWVEFKVYNYGEFYTVARKKADREGRASLTAGRGDMLVYASQPDGAGGYRYGLAKVSVGTDTLLRLELRYTSQDRLDLDMKITPPREDARYPLVTAEKRAENDRRMKAEDVKRNAYVTTFLDKQLEGFDARGNWSTIRAFVDEAADKTRAIGLLRAVSAKDLRDVELTTLKDHLEHTLVRQDLGLSPDLQMRYVYNPRVANEQLTPYKSYFQSYIPEILQHEFKASIESIRLWCLEQIRDDEGYNPLSYPISPIGVWRGRRADRHSLGIFFVSLARSMGWAARIDPITTKVQYYDQDRWQDVALELQTKSSDVREGILRLGYTDNGIVDNPRYYYHFSISKFGKDGRLKLLNYDEGENGLEQGTSWKTTFEPGTPLDEGQYMLVSGSRLANGSVLVNLQTFGVRASQIVESTLVMRRDTTAVSVLGNFNSEQTFAYLAEAPGLTTQALAEYNAEEQTILSTTGRGYYILGLLGPGEEPTNHALRDIIAERELLEAWGQKVLLLFADQTRQDRYRAEDFPGLPKTVVFGRDIEGRVLAELCTNLKLRKSDLPIFVIADTFNRVVFVSQGYTIGLGRQLRSVLTALQKDSCSSPTRSCTIP
ncbi:MAG: transglutaminase-like domain-containing protein [Porphyromonadaceae bacterium]|nr:transglutaminase-like domain-containing protein [Porphyromonadaceae bacterium]